MFRTGKKFSREVSIYDPIGADKDGETVSLLDILEAGDREVLETVIIKQDVKILYEAYKENLTDMEQTVIRMRYGLFGTKEHTQRDTTGVRTNGTSRIGFNMIGIPNVSISFKLKTTVNDASPASFPVRSLRKNKSNAIRTLTVVPQPPIATYTS